ncbi:MAG: D-2-hydroxyacid dehydrogenase [Anaerolineales bacterium]|nr:D-2-hydroxyacid dehydrogenase [Anaerolineales bacterium]
MSLPERDNLTICFAHPAYQMAATFAQRQTGNRHFQVWNEADLRARLPEADLLVVSGLWRNDLLPLASRLKFIQSISAGINQYDQAALRAAGVRLASAAGVNSNAVAEHAIALMLALTRHIHWGRDRQHKGEWRGLISDLSQREDELAGKTLLVVGAGRIGSRLAQLGAAFRMQVLATKRDTSKPIDGVAELHRPETLPQLLPRADFVVLTCPLTPETTDLIDAAALAAMKPSAFLINVARGGVVNEAALLAALQAEQIAGAALDTVADEPLPAESPIWREPKLIVTPHTGGETRRYEANVIDILLENIARLWAGEEVLRNQIV